MKWDFRGLLVLTFWIVLLASGLWASATDLGVYARCMGRSVDEGDGLLNVETSRATALAPRGRYCFCLRRSRSRFPLRAGLIRNLCLHLWTSRPVRVTRLTHYRLVDRAVGAQRRLFSIKPVLLVGES